MATIKQQIAFREVVKGSTLKGAMQKAKYSLETSKRTNKLTRTKGWKELINKYIDEKELAKKHKEQLNASKHVKLYFDIDDDNEMIEKVCKKLGVELLFIKENKAKDGKTVNVKAPDFMYRDLALDKGYKIRGKYIGENTQANKTMIINITGETAQRFNVITTPDSENSSTGYTQV